MGEDHRPQEADAAGEPDGGLEGERLHDPDREEDDGERLRRGVELAREQVGDERLRHEAAPEAVEREQARETHDDAAGAVEPWQGLLLELVSTLDCGREARGGEEARPGANGPDSTTKLCR